MVMEIKIFFFHTITVFAIPPAERETRAEVMEIKMCFILSQYRLQKEEEITERQGKELYKGIIIIKYLLLS